MTVKKRKAAAVVSTMQSFYNSDGSINAIETAPSNRRKVNGDSTMKLQSYFKKALQSKARYGLSNHNLNVGSSSEMMTNYALTASTLSAQFQPMTPQSYAINGQLPFHAQPPMHQDVCKSKSYSLTSYLQSKLIIHVYISSPK